MSIALVLDRYFILRLFVRCLFVCSFIYVYRLLRLPCLPPPARFAWRTRFCQLTRCYASPAACGGGRRDGVRRNAPLRSVVAMGARAHLPGSAGMACANAHRRWRSHSIAGRRGGGGVRRGVPSWRAAASRSSAAARTRARRAALPRYAAPALPAL